MSPDGSANGGLTGVDTDDWTRTELAPDAEWPFVVCLTHDVDRLSHRLPTLARLREAPSARRLRRLLGDTAPYWQFGTIRDVERDLGVRSSFYFLNEKSLFTDKRPNHWVRPQSWSLYSYYDIQRPAVRAVIETLADSAWEVGLQGSYESFDDRVRLAYEKSVLGEITGTRIRGGRQHYLNGRFPETWRHHRAIGLVYDTTLGSATEYGFDYGHDVIHPFGDDFAVFPLTVMDQALMESTDSVAAAKGAVDRLLTTARETGAVVTVDWHQRTFDDLDFPGYADVYRYLVERALELGAWVGPTGDAYELLVEGDAGRPVAGVTPAAVDDGVR
ncbi:polysaccharide deacetylase family protein [Halomicroarcula sp. GCM10025709]|uniref:polysaccharide deacetylase family protein n=1 Tax=Haloarcula TaxID=2237 RepID=UPI0024C222D5|nr:polysaccharide deacetylase family protein [Halomicroarcula sp. YJ-61-S]